jgi:AraC family transcriptional regulator
MLTSSMFADIDPIPIATFEGRFPRSSQADPSLSGDRRSHFSYRHAQRTGSAARTSSDRQALDLADHVVEISPAHAVTRRTATSDGMTAEIVQATSHDRFEFRFRAPVHLLVVYEQGARRDGDTFVEGLSRSTLRDFARKLTFVPAGHEYREWQEPRTLARLMYVYFDPAKLQIPCDGGSADVGFAAKLFFEDATLLDTALKLKRSLESPTLENRLYFEALGVVLAHELIRFNDRRPQSEPQFRGGLAAWQQRMVTAHIDEHLGETIPLATLAQLARLSPYYFCRAFKQSFGVPPHRYHTSRRIEHAKAMLATRTHSVTEIGLTVGYSETSSFTAAFRKAVGLTPSAYQRSLG